MSGPLRGVRIVTMGGLGPGPFCGMLLGDLGADVVRVDMPRAVDGALPIDYTVRRSQRSIALDVKDAAGRAILLQLIETADAFIEVFRPGVAERLGIGPDDLHQRNPRLVYARMTGYGQDGPYADRAGHDINYIALAGALHGIGTAEAPVPPLNLVGDYGGGGMLLAVGLLSAILDARASQQGQVVDVAMVDGAAALMAPYYGMVAAGTWRDQRHANVLDGAAHYYGVYETADDKHVAVGAMEPQFYAELCERLGVDVPQDEENRRRGWRIARRWRRGFARRRAPSGNNSSAHQGAAPHPYSASPKRRVTRPTSPVARSSTSTVWFNPHRCRGSPGHRLPRRADRRCPVITPATCWHALGWTTWRSPIFSRQASRGRVATELRRKDDRWRGTSRLTRTGRSSWPGSISSYARNASRSI
jgi:crotonobetainyl-CoA:carnitine CoA-transferase CaiB-like acyl-CoA transferase